MRTFIFIKNEWDCGITHKVIKGMVQSDYFPSIEISPGGDFYGCKCVEVTDKCTIDLGRFID